MGPDPAAPPVRLVPVGPEVARIERAIVSYLTRGPMDLASQAIIRDALAGIKGGKGGPR